jgi:hypothetical protein
MSEQEASQNRWNETANGARQSQSFSPWVVLVVILTVVSLTTLFWWLGRTAEPVGAITQLEPRSSSQVALLATAAEDPIPSPTATAATAIALLPTLTPTPERRPTSTETAVAVLLPTATPTLEPVAIALHTVEIDGATTVSMTLGNADFSSSGRPLRFAFDNRRYDFDGRTLRHLDRWCVQLGIVHVVIELDLELNAETEAVRGEGNAQLIGDYCDSPNEVISDTPIIFNAPVNQRAQFVYKLQGRRSLFNLPGVYDAATSVSIVLNVHNKRAE